jgi:DNA polymerase
MVQPQNFPRGTIKDMNLLVQLIKYGDPELLEAVFGNQMEAVSSALRGMLIAEEGHTLFVSDFSNIEARVVMWCAGQEDALEAFRKNDRKEGPDIYCVMAEKLYGRPINKKDDPDERGSGKVTILGCGYQMAAPRLKEQAKSQYGVELTLDRAEFLVNTFRTEYSLVPIFWQGVQDAAMEALNKPGARITFRCVTFQVVEDAAGKWLTCKLPSGRLLWYFNPRIEEVEKEWGKVWNIAYEGRNNKQQGIWSTVYTYGGMLTENIVQAIARDIMVESMYLVEAAGYTLILTVHDEVVAEVPIGFGNIKEFDRIMAVTPHWAPGCPVAAEGWVGPRYKKD